MAKTETPISQSDIITGIGKEYTVSKPARKTGQLLGVYVVGDFMGVVVEQERERGSR